MEVLNIMINVLTAIAKAVMEFGGNAAEVIAAIPGFLNNNQGVLAVLALVVAIIVAVKPDKKKLTVHSELGYDEQGNFSITLSLYNAGSVSLYLKHIEVKQVSKRRKRKEEWPHNIWNQIEEEKRFLEPQKTYDYPLGQFACVAGQEKNTDLLIVITTEEKTFKKRIDWAVG
ncbi:MAG: hypothetical protein LUE89_02600 [Clostridiales bacterium]|nr:hypothetical protein [Clostridiales bacterium]